MFEDPSRHTNRPLICRLLPRQHGAEHSCVCSSQPSTCLRSDKGFHLCRQNSEGMCCSHRHRTPQALAQRWVSQGTKCRVLTMYVENMHHIPLRIWLKDCSLETSPRLAKPTSSQLCPQALPLPVYLHATTLPSCPSVWDIPDSQFNYL